MTGDVRCWVAHSPVAEFTAQANRLFPADEHFAGAWLKTFQGKEERGIFSLHEEKSGYISIEILGVYPDEVMSIEDGLDTMIMESGPFWVFLRGTPKAMMKALALIADNLPPSEIETTPLLTSGTVQVMANYLESRGKWPVSSEPAPAPSRMG